MKVDLVLSDVEIDLSEISTALEIGRRNGVPKGEVASALGMTPHNLRKIAGGEFKLVKLDTILKIQEMTGHQILPDFLMMGV